MRTVRVSNTLLGVVIVFGFLVIIFQPVLLNAYREYTHSQYPWYSASIEVMDSRGPFGLPLIKYTKIVSKETTGDWNAWIELVPTIQLDHPANGNNQPVEGILFCGGSGADGNYTFSDTGEDPLLWDYFLGKPCPEPNVPYRVCADWIMTDIQTNMKQVIPAVCSDVVFPEIPSFPTKEELQKLEETKE